MIKLMNGNKIYIYNIGYYSYEEIENVQLYHKKRFNKKEFENIITKATINLLKKHEIKKDKYITFQDILDSIIEELIKNFGFKKVKFTAEFNVFGWANILDEKDWKYDRNEQLNLLTKTIKFRNKNKKRKKR